MHDRIVRTRDIAPEAEAPRIAPGPAEYRSDGVPISRFLDHEGDLRGDAFCELVRDVEALAPDVRRRLIRSLMAFFDVGA